MNFSQFNLRLSPIFLWGIATSVILCSAHAAAQPVVISRDGAVEQSVGTQYVYESYAIVHPLQPPVRESYSVELTELWPGGVSFKYRVEQSVIGTEEGIQTLTSLDDCKTIDPWWEPSEIEFDDRCELWISPKAYRELVTTGTSYLTVDKLARHDSVVRWERTAFVHFLVTRNGYPAMLNALKAQTSRGDEFIILADPDNPLILSAKSTHFSWTLKSIGCAGSDTQTLADKP